jgi:hypothetical protein
LVCGVSFSYATGTLAFGQNKRRINEPFRRLYASGVSLRRAARLLRVHRKTIARKLSYLALCATRENDQFLEANTGKFSAIQFDELETSEHTKLKPLSVPLVVCAETRKILAFDVAVMPAKGLLVEKSLKKYGKRPDHRSRVIAEMFTKIQPILTNQTTLLSDENPRYPALIKEHLPNITHFVTKGRRGSVGGQGELKKIGFDPLFSLNHTCAMLRANVNRLFRKTWCTTKCPKKLKEHLAIYVAYHNSVLTA